PRRAAEPPGAAPGRSLIPAAMRDRRGAGRDTSSARGSRLQRQDVDLSREGGQGGVGGNSHALRRRLWRAQAAPGTRAEKASANGFLDGGSGARLARRGVCVPLRGGAYA